MGSVRIQELLTGADSSSLVPAYVWWAVSMTVGLGLEVYSVITGNPFDLQAYGIGVGALMVGAGWSKKVGG